MDPALWAWIGVGAAVVAVAPVIPTMRSPQRPVTAVVMALGAAVAVAASGAAWVPGWSRSAAAAAVAGGLAALLAVSLGRATTESPAPLLAATRASRLAVAAAGLGLGAGAIVRLAVDGGGGDVAGGALGAGAAAAAMAMRLGVAGDSEPRSFRPELTALTVLAVTSGAWFGGGEAAVWPTITVTVGVAVAVAVSSLAVRSDPTHSLLWRGWIVAAVVAVSGPVVAIASPPVGVRHPIGLGLAVTAGAVGAVVVGELIRLYTSDRWRPAKRVAARARTGAAAVITTGLADAARATGWLLAGVAAVGVAADRFGRLADEHDLALVLAVAAMTACLAAMAAGLEVSGMAERAGSPDDTAPPEEQAAAADLLAAGSVVGAVGRGTTTLVASLSALTLLLIGLRRAVLDPAGGWAAVGALGGVAAVWYATGWLSATADGDTASPRRGGYAAAAVLVAAVAAVLVSPAAGLGAVAGAVVSGGALAFWGGVAAGSWQNVRRLIEAGAYGGVGSRAHRAVVAADTIGSRWRGVIVPGSMSALLAVAALVALFSSPPG